MTTQTKLYCQQIRVTITQSYYFEYYLILNTKLYLYSILFCCVKLLCELAVAYKTRS